MTGMKEGAGEDPFADDPEPQTTDEPDETRAVDTTTPKPEPDSTETAPSERQPMQIPYKYRRDGVQDGRNRVPLFLQEETKDGERDALRELEDRFSEDVSLTDLREALVKTGLDHLDEVEAQLEEWGYGMTFES